MLDTMSSKSKVKRSFGFAEMIDSEPTTCGGILAAEACISTRHQENQKFDRLLEVEDEINNRPRNVLAYQSPNDLLDHLRAS
jgi:hypothetical protein